MKELASLSANHGAYYFGKEDRIAPITEVVLVFREPTYRYTNTGEISKEQELTTVRFSAQPDGLRLLARSLTELASQSEDYLSEEVDRIEREERNRITNARMEAAKDAAEAVHPLNTTAPGP